MYSYRSASLEAIQLLSLPKSIFGSHLLHTLTHIYWFDPFFQRVFNPIVHVCVQSCLCMCALLLMTQLLDFQLMINFVQCKPSKATKTLFTSIDEMCPKKKKSGKFSVSKNIVYGLAIICCLCDSNDCLSLNEWKNWIHFVNPNVYSRR